MEKKYHNWHKIFFSGLWLELQTKMYSDEQTEKQAKFIANVLKLKKKAKVLDCPCGNGRISNKLSKKGFEVTGIDNNDFLLKEAVKNSKKLKLNTTYLKTEMYKIDFDNKFDAVICFWGSFGYFDDKTNLNFLKNVFKALKPGGKFLLDTHTVESILTKFQKNGWFKVGNIFVTEYRTYDIINSRIISNWTIIKNGKIENKNTSIRLYSYKELTNLLKSIGFKKFTAYGSLKKEEFSNNPNRLYLVAQK